MNFSETYFAWTFQWKWAAIKNGMKNAVAYRGEFLIDLFSSAFVPAAIQFILWQAIFHNTGITTFAGMSYSELLGYTWTSILFTQIRGGDYDFSLIEMIRTGSLNNYLIRPVGIVEFTYFQGFGEKAPTLIFCMALGLIATIFSSITLPHLFMAMSLAFVGSIIHYFFGACLSVVAFYWENAFAVLMVKNMAVSLLSGELIPLSIIPLRYSWVWHSTPFYLYVFGPTQLALGKWNQAMWAQQMMIALAWLVFFWGLSRILWAHCIRRYQGIGG